MNVQFWVNEHKMQPPVAVLKVGGRECVTCKGNGSLSVPTNSVTLTGRLVVDKYLKTMIFVEAVDTAQSHKVHRNACNAAR